MNRSWQGAGGNGVNCNNCAAAGSANVEFWKNLRQGRELGVTESDRIQQLESQIQALREQLKDLQCAAENQARLADRSAEVQRETEQFAYVASHDLKEPLRTVANYLGLLRRRYGSQLDEVAHDYMQTAQDATVRMRQLIDSLLEYSKAQSLETSVQALGPSAERAVQNLAQLIEDNQAKIEIGPLPQVCIDDTQITRVFQNLITNALKYRGVQAPRVKISAQRESDVWRINVQDNGMGIAAEDQLRIFQMFNRLHRRDEVDGSGIGLATCQRIVQSHGGDISVTSTPGKGATFSFSLPVQTAEVAA
ncbi:MAG: sensor histidine kinase [Oceanococcus sp.]